MAAIFTAITVSGCCRVAVIVVIVVRGLVVRFAQQLGVVAQRKFVTGNQLSATDDAPETRDMVDVGTRLHDEVVGRELPLTLGAFHTEQSTNNINIAFKGQLTLNFNLLFIECVAVAE